MANPVFEFVKGIASLTRDVQQGKENVKQLQEDMRFANQRIDNLIEAFQRLSYEFKIDRENGARDREIHRLKIELALQEQRRLPAGAPRSDDSQSAEIEALRRENEELRTRLAQLEQERNAE